ncbi:MAG: antibiotic biosynthesis monooxygenase [Chloroflexi bacterium]|nr:antibiotic biosynthesis monooxygenase [Chloroflexota bacterium]
MAQVIEQGNIVAFLIGGARAATREGWARDLDGVWHEMAAALKKQKGFLGMKALWNIEDNQEIIVLAYWDNLEDRLAYERTAAGGVRARMETTLQGPPPRPKYEVMRARGASLDGVKVGQIAAVLTARSHASTRAAFDQDLKKVWEEATGIASMRPGFVAAQALWSIENTRQAHIVGFWESLDNRLSYEGSVAGPVRARFESILEPPYPRPKYVIVKST